MAGSPSGHCLAGGDEEVRASGTFQHLNTAASRPLDTTIEINEDGVKTSQCECLQLDGQGGNIRRAAAVVAGQLRRSAADADGRENNLIAPLTTRWTSSVAAVAAKCLKRKSIVSSRSFHRPPAQVINKRAMASGSGSMPNEHHH